MNPRMGFYVREKCETVIKTPAFKAEKQLKK